MSDQVVEEGLPDVQEISLPEPDFSGGVEDAGKRALFSRVMGLFKREEPSLKDEPLIIEREDKKEEIPDPQHPDGPMRMGRSRFLKTVVGGAAATALLAACGEEPVPKKVPTPEPAKAPPDDGLFKVSLDLSKIPEGQLPKIYDAKTMKPIEELDIINGLKTSRFGMEGYGPVLGTVKIKAFDREYIVPFDQIKMENQQESPLKEVVLKNNLGILVHEADALRYAMEMGLGAVRIDARLGTLEDLKRVQGIVEEAKKCGVKILLEFNPSDLIPTPELQKRVGDLLNMVQGYKNVSFELGNEPDNEGNSYWKPYRDANTPEQKYRAMGTYAQFVRDTAKLIREKRGEDTRIVVGGLVSNHHTKDLLENLEGLKVDLSKFAFGLHSYGELDDLKSRVEFLNEEFTKKRHMKPEVVLTELGKQAIDKTKLFLMLSKAKELGINETYFYTLVDDPNESGFGMLTERPTGIGKTYDHLGNSYYLLQQLTQGLPKNPGELLYKTR